jgi:hypothetical protein
MAEYGRGRGKGWQSLNREEEKDGRGWTEKMERI